jgi:hypothetical protein
MSSDGRSGYACGQRKQFADDKYSRQRYRKAPHFTYQQLNVRGHLECSHETHTTSPTSELGKNQESSPNKQNHAEKVEMQNKTEPEREKTAVFHRQQKESGDYFNTDYIHKSKVQEIMNLCSNCKHNLICDCKSNSEEWQRDGFQANTKTAFEVARNRSGGDDKARIYYGGQSRQTIHRLPKFNTRKPPILKNCVTATYHDLLSPCNESFPPLDDKEPGLLRFSNIMYL